MVDLFRITFYFGFDRRHLVDQANNAFTHGEPPWTRRELLVMDEIIDLVNANLGLLTRDEDLSSCVFEVQAFDMTQDSLRIFFVDPFDLCVIEFIRLERPLRSNDFF
jgi:hypothetical protein